MLWSTDCLELCIYPREERIRSPVTTLQETYTKWQEAGKSGDIVTDLQLERWVAQEKAMLTLLEKARKLAQKAKCALLDHDIEMVRNNLTLIERI